MTDEACAFTAPEMLQGRAISTRMAMEKVSISLSTAIIYISKTDHHSNIYTHLYLCSGLCSVKKCVMFISKHVLNLLY